MMMIQEANVHMALDTRNYNKVVNHFKNLGCEVKTQSHKGSPLYSTVQVTLFLSPSDNRSFESVAIHDRTYSKHVLRIERSTNDDSPYQV